MRNIHILLAIILVIIYPEQTQTMSNINIIKIVFGLALLVAFILSLTEKPDKTVVAVEVGGNVISDNQKLHRVYVKRIGQSWVYEEWSTARISSAVKEGATITYK